MKKEGRIVLAALASLILVTAVWALPTTHSTALLGASNAQAAPQTQSVSGTIASVEKNSFTLTVGAAQPGGGAQPQKQGVPGTPQTMTFMIDKNTTIDGTLKVDANADVTYRVDNGQNIAINVRVSS